MLGLQRSSLRPAEPRRCGGQKRSSHRVSEGGITIRKISILVARVTFLLSEEKCCILSLRQSGCKKPQKKKKKKCLPECHKLFDTYMSPTELFCCTLSTNIFHSQAPHVFHCRATVCVCVCVRVCDLPGVGSGAVHQCSCYRY